MAPDDRLYATIHVDAEEFLNGMSWFRGQDPGCVPARLIKPAPLRSKLPPKILAMIQFDDFRRLARGLDKSSNT